MVNSRDIAQLHPKVAQMCLTFLSKCGEQGIDVIVTSTYRDNESQAALYAQGRTAPGSIVTNAKPGDSYHNWRVAFDFVPIVHGKAAWDDAELFTRCGVIAESVGLEWAGRWKKFKELAHCQYTGGLSLTQFKAGEHLPD